MYFKVFNDEDNHHNFQYQDGLNVDTKEFQKEGSCVAGGLYFADEKHICGFLGYGNFIRQVEVPDGEKQFVKDPDENKFRSHSLFLHPRKDLRKKSTWKWLIENKVDIHANYNCALRWASYHGYHKVVKLLIKNGADVKAQDNYALRSASCNGHLEVVKLLLENGADVKAQDNSVIKLASHNGHLEVVKILIENGADVQAQDNYALRWASRRGHHKVVKLLIENGADESVLK